MHLQSLHHLIEIVQAVARPRRVTVIGSGSLLTVFPSLGDTGQPLETTADADFLLEPINDALAESLQFAAGAESAFQQEFSYYADILHPTIVETLPAGWERRLHPVAGYDRVFALDPYDLAVVKLTVGRPKDLELLRALLQRRLITPDRLQAH